MFRIDPRPAAGIASGLMSNRILVAASAALLMVGCGGGATDPIGTGGVPTGTGGAKGTGGAGGAPPASNVVVTNNGCPLPPSGIFLVHSVQGSGNNCGAIPDFLLNGDSPSMVSCTGGSGSVVDTLTADGGCKVVVDLKGCAVTGGTFDLLEQVTWAADYRSASGVESLNVSGTGACLGTYAVTITKQ